MKSWKSPAMLFLFIVLCLGVAGAVGADVLVAGVRPVWTVLYLMMAVAVWLVWRMREKSHIRVALALFFIQLLLNAAWSPLFFGLRNPLAGLLDIIPLWWAILATIISFGKISPAAAILFVPYWLWVGFATALNFAIWNMNR